MKNAENNLRNTLKANAGFSSAWGIALIIWHPELSNWMGVEMPMVLLIIGIGLLLFAAVLFYLAFGKTIKPGAIKSIVYQDWGWVLGSAILLIGQFFELSLPGQLLIGAVAAVVASFAILQSKWLKGLTKT